MEQRRHLAGDWFWPNDVEWPVGGSPYLGGDDIISVQPSAVANSWDVVLNGVISATSPADLSSIQIADGNGNDVVDCTLMTIPLKSTGYSGHDSIWGTNANDTINSGYGDDFVYGRGGNDSIDGSYGADRVEGSAGNDTLYGGNSPDVVLGGNGNDTVYGGEGNDSPAGGDGNDLMYGGSDDDRLEGAAGNDTIYGDSGVDELTGGTEDDKLTGGFGADSLFGNDGNDTLYATDGEADTRIYGGDGDDFGFADLLLDTGLIFGKDRISSISITWEIYVPLRDGSGDNATMITPTAALDRMHSVGDEVLGMNS